MADFQTWQNFYPRPPRGGRPGYGDGALYAFDFYPRPPRGGRHLDAVPCGVRGLISIHALREEGDENANSMIRRRHPFLSTPSARRATPCRPERRWLYQKFLSTPSARRATCNGPCKDALDKLFLSTPSARRATALDVVVVGIVGISIHALREEGDAGNWAAKWEQSLFLSTPSARRATCKPTTWICLRLFLSTPSARRATMAAPVMAMSRRISIHALREEGDLVMDSTARGGGLFLSTPSARRATAV